jgi:hypothetical protein
MDSTSVTASLSNTVSEITTSAVNTVDRAIGPWIKNKWVSTVIVLIFILYASTIAFKLPVWTKPIFDHWLFRVVMVFLVAFIYSQNAGVGLGVALAFLVTVVVMEMNNNNKKIFNFIYGEPPKPASESASSVSSVSSSASASAPRQTMQVTEEVPAGPVPLSAASSSFMTL